MNLPTTTPEQRAPLYKDVEDMVQVGFLSHSVMIGNTQVCLRSLLPGDLHLLKWRAVKAETWRTWIIASSLWMVDGISLIDEPHAAPRMARTLKGVPNGVLNILFSISIGLFNRASKALSLAESYCYEDISRYLWRTLGRKSPSSQTGIPGVERLGINPVQGIWVLFNQSEDDRVVMDSYWEGAKLIASAMSPKGVQKLDQKDKQQKADEKSRRQRVMDRVYYASKGIVSPDGQSKGGDRVSLQGAHSPEELEEEMRRWVNGEEDWHDRVVSDYKRKVKDNMERIKRERQERLEAIRRESEQRDQEEAGPMPMVAYTQEQMAEILAQRQAGGPSGRRRVFLDGDQRQQLYERYLERKPGPPQRMVATPDGGLSPLEAELQIRQVPFRSGGEG